MYQKSQITLGFHVLLIKNWGVLISHVWSFKDPNLNAQRGTRQFCTNQFTDLKTRQFCTDQFTDLNAQRGTRQFCTDQFTDLNAQRGTRQFWRPVPINLLTWMHKEAHDSFEDLYRSIYWLECTKRHTSVLKTCTDQFTDLNAQRGTRQFWRQFWRPVPINLLTWMHKEAHVSFEDLYRSIYWLECTKRHTAVLYQLIYMDENRINLPTTAK